MTDLRRWQNITVQRAVALEMATHEIEEARTTGDPDRIISADRYFHETKRMHAAAERKLLELA